MARNGSGTYSLPQAAFVSGTVISSTAVNSDFSDIATALTQSIASDGQTPITANLPMSGYKHTGVANASARTDYAATGQVQDSSFTWCGTAGGTADALTLTPTPAISAYATGQRFSFKAGSSANTGATTVAVSGLSAKAVQLNDAALVAGDIAANKYYEIVYDGTQFQLNRISAAASSVSVASNAEVSAATNDTKFISPLKLATYAWLPADGRLTLTTATPVTTTDVTAASTIYYTPYVGNRIALYNGTSWSPYTFTERSLALSGLNLNSLYDVFIYDNSGTLTLEATEWSRTTVTMTIATPCVVTENSHGRYTGQRVSLTTTGALPTGLSANTTYYVISTGANTYNLATSYANAIAGTAIATSGSQSGVHSVSPTRTRATALTYQDGVLVKTGSTGRRYLGTFRTTATNQTEDSDTKRYLFNYYNRVNRRLKRQETTASWTYSTGTTRQANASESNQVEIVAGVLEDAVSVLLNTSAYNSTSTSRSCGVGIGVNGITGTSAEIFNYLAVAAQTVSGPCVITHTPSLGWNVYSWLEYGAGVDTQTWQGQTNSGLFGQVRA